MENKYYDYLKPKLPKQSFSDIVNEQMQLVQQQQKERLAQDFLVQKEQRKILDTQQKELLGFDVAQFSDVDREVFAAKKDWLADRIQNFYYTGGKRSEFIADVNGLKTRFEELEQHQKNTNKEKESLEGFVSGTKPWTDKTLKLGDTKESLDYKVSQWNNSGIEPGSMEVDPATGDTYGYYIDINGTRIQDEAGADQYGPVQLSPTRGSKEYFAPTVSPYENLLPGAFSKDFSAAATRLKNNQTMSYEEKEAVLREWVTTTASGNQSAIATAKAQFMSNYGEEQSQAILVNDQSKNGEQEGYIPMDMKEYVDETMRFLKGNLMDKPDKGDSSDPKVFPSSVQFNLQDFNAPQDFEMGPYQPTGDESSFGKGISSLMVPKSGVGKSSVMVESTYTPTSDDDPRAREISDQYRVLGVAMDESDVPNLFIRAEMYVEENIDALDPAYAATLKNYDINSDGKTVNTKTVKNIVVGAYTEGGENNQEYVSVLAQIGYAAGATKGDRNAAIKKGLESLRSYNDSEAQIFASLPTP